MDQASVFNQFVSVKCCPFNILLCYITQSPMACSAEHSSTLVVSALVFPRQRELLCSVRMSGSVIQLPFSQGNMASASLPSVGHVCCV